MGRTYPEIDDGLRRFLAAQKMFFVATAPAGGEGHVNVSPKGLDTLRVLDPHTVAYLDFTGSGAETIAHLRENRRITLMVCAFAGAPRIVRLYGRGEVIEPTDPDWSELRTRFPEGAARSIIRIKLTRIADSCGHGVPLYHHEGERNLLPAFAARKGEAGLRDYQRQKNAASIDGLPALRWIEKG